MHPFSLEKLITRQVTGGKGDFYTTLALREGGGPTTLALKEDGGPGDVFTTPVPEDGLEIRPLPSKIV